MTFSFGQIGCFQMKRFVPNYKLDILVTATFLTLKSGILVVCKIDLSSYQYNGREIVV